MTIVVKRVYETPDRSDGTRVLVDRLWPRGLSKEKAAIQTWLRDLAPSNELRRWFHAHPEAWIMFRRHYLEELCQPEAAAPLEELYRLSQKAKRLTLLFGSKNEQRNNAVVLKELLNGMRKPPTGTGPAAAGAARERVAKRMPRR
jgi:uncharacterized protein YeaO (DUF488 family)